MATILPERVRGEGLANRLREQRKARGLTQAALAYMVGVSERTIRSWESGEASPPKRQAAKLARRLGVTVEALALGKPT